MTQARIAAVRRRRTAIQRLEVLGRALGLVAFAVAIYLSGRLGVEMARNRQPDRATNSPTPSETVSAGGVGDPLYLSRTPEALRRFFAAHPTPEERSSANLSGFGIRRLKDRMELSVLGAEADGVQVKVESGALSGSVYWIHHSQLPSTTVDPIVPPVPGYPL